MNKNSDIILVEEIRTESHNGDSCHSPEVHEIESDDCIVADENPSSKVSEKKVQLRRSSRTIKRKRYTDDLENGDESDVEEISYNAPPRKSRPIVINDTKALVEMAAKQMKSNHGNSPKKEPTVVIIDTNSMISGKCSIPQSKHSTSTASLNAQSLYQSIVARGTTVTPVSSKSNASTQSSSNAQVPILPSLTDDMFVVEAPSFIVPYVYEKPSIKPFREFVDLLGKELEEQRAEEEKERTEKEKEEKEKRDKEKEEKRARGEEVEDSEEEVDAKLETTEILTKQEEDEEEKKKKRTEKKKGI